MEYGSGLTSGQAFMLDKERIKEAFNNRIVVGEDENGFIYESCTKEEAEEFILSVFDHAVYQCSMAHATGRATDRILQEMLKKNNISSSVFINQFLEYRAEEIRKNGDYVYEGQETAEKESRKNRFSVIQGGKNDN